MKLSSAGPNLLGFLASIILRIVNATVKWRMEGLIKSYGHWSTGTPVILVFWHGDQLFMPWCYRTNAKQHKIRPIYALVSMHADGRICANALGNLSVRSIDGSSSRGAARAILRMKQKLDEGCHVGISPDGPKGPRHIAKQGPVLLSSHSGYPILPVGVHASRAWIFKSWDKMFLPKLFSKVGMVVGDPYTVLPKLSREDLAKESDKLTNTLNRLKIRAAELVK